MSAAQRLHAPVALAAGGEMAKDPICGMLLDKTKAFKSERGGRAYYFFLQPGVSAHL